MEAPKAFISYSWDGEEHNSWVRLLAERLRSDGVDAMLDAWHLVPGDQLTQFMEDAVRNSDFVLVVCTPRYKQKSDARAGGVGYEGGIMTAEVFLEKNHRKFVPILRKGTWREASPTWLDGKLYIDFSNQSNFTSSYTELLEALHRVVPTIPPLGSPPASVAARKQDNVAAESPAEESEKTEEFESISIVEIIANEVGLPRNDGTPGSGLYSVPLRLSHTPTPEWEQLFVENWDSPPEFTTMHRPGIARVEGRRIVLDGTTIQEIEHYHRDTLKVVLREVNRGIANFERKKRHKQRQAQLAQQALENSIRKASKSLKF